MKKFIIIAFPLFCFYVSSGQAGSEIYLFDLSVKNGQVVISNGVNITNHKGYDNQPYFHPSKPVIYYSSFNDSGRSDIKYYNYETKQTANLTLTNEREYSPTLTPDEQFISCIIQRDNGAQDLGKYPVGGGSPEVLINELKIGYHAWAGKNRLLLFVLGDSNNHTLHYYNLSTKKDTVLAINIGRSLHPVPNQDAMSFVQKTSDKEGIIKKFELSTGVISSITPTLEGQDHLTWLQNNTLLMSNGSKLFSYRVNKDRAWQTAIIDGDSLLIKGISRLATNNANTKLAIVISE
jgi:Tol biopolymer transport system component